MPLTDKVQLLRNTAELRAPIRSKIFMSPFDVFSILTVRVSAPFLRQVSTANFNSITNPIMMW